LLEGDVEAQDQARFLNMIISESARLSRLANDLLTLQRIEGGTGEIRLSRFSLQSAVERAQESLGPLIEMRGVQFEVLGEAPTVLGDIDRIQQVVVNLVDNASRVVGEDGRVRIEFFTVARSELGPLVHEPGLADVEHFALMCVSDSGPGIPEGDVPRLFDRFYRHQYSRDRKTGGSGLGLSIVKAIVLSHAGAITMRNLAEKEGGGACFMVYLPIPPEPDMKRLERFGEPEKSGRGERVRLLRRREDRSSS
jgi:signal transduction histidine kinase